jgi:hypothetical protein
VLFTKERLWIEAWQGNGRRFEGSSAKICGHLRHLRIAVWIHSIRDLTNYDGPIG